MEMKWKPEYESKYVAMGFSAEKISGIRYGFEEMTAQLAGFESAFKNAKWDK